MVEVLQNVIAIGGFAYGVVNGDLHVHGDGRPVYTLELPAPRRRPPLAWLLELPSRLLDARHGIVPFSGRDDELARLGRWRDDDDRLAILLLHGSGGQGKTRLATEFADRSAAEGWKVVVARHGGDTVTMPPSGQDLAAGSAPGLLLIVDYADRWPYADLTWLLRNRLLHTPVPTRVLLIGRSTHFWPAARHLAEEVFAATADLPLGPLPDRRTQFSTAFTTFAGLYGVSDPPVPSPPDLELVLSLHMAALVAVDAAARGEQAPAESDRFSAYLLRREYAHWTRLHERHQIRSSPAVIARAGFVAGLTGEVPAARAHELLTIAAAGGTWPFPAPDIAADHAVCYPPAPEHALAPLYPDRLAEDFLALTLPGHEHTGHPSDPWSAAATPALLNGGLEPRRAVTFLAAAGTRWRHVGPGHLFPLLRADPGLAVTAGAAAVAAIAELPEADIDVLHAVAALLPDRDVEFDGATALVQERITVWHLEHDDDLEQTMLLLDNLIARLSLAGRHGDGLTYAVHAFAVLDARDPDGRGHLGRRASLLTNVSGCMRGLGRQEEALENAIRSVSAYRELNDDDPADLARALSNTAGQLSNMGRLADALPLIDEAVEIRDRSYRADADRHRIDLAFSLGSKCVINMGLGRWETASAAGERSVALFREARHDRPAAVEPDLARALMQYAPTLVQGRRDEALAAGEEAVVLYRRLAELNPAEFTIPLAAALHFTAFLKRPSAGAADAQEAVSLTVPLALRRVPHAEDDLLLYLSQHPQIAGPADAEEAAAVNFLATRRLQDDDLDAAERLLRYGMRSGDPHCLHNLAKLMLARDDVVQAVELLRRAVRAGHTHALIDLGLVHEAAGHPRKAIRYYRRAVKAGETEVLRPLAALLAADGHREEAEALYRRAVDTGDTAALLPLADLLSDESLYRKAIALGDTDALCRLGHLLANRDDLDGAEPLYRQAIEAGNVEALRNYGMLHDKRGDRDQAREYYRRAVDAGDFSALLPLARVVIVDDRAAAADILEEAVRRGYSEALFDLANLRANDGDTERAAPLYRRAAKAGHRDAIRNLGLLHADTGDPRTAEKLLRQAAREGSARAWADLARVQTGQGHQDAAVDSHLHAIEMGDTAAVLDLAKLLDHMQRFDEAEARYREAAENGSESALHLLGDMMVRRGDITGAEATYRQAVEGGHTHALTDLLSLIYVHRRREFASTWLRYRKAFMDPEVLAQYEERFKIRRPNGPFGIIWKLFVRYQKPASPGD